MKENWSLNLLLSGIFIAFVGYVFLNYNDKVIQHKENKKTDKEIPEPTQLSPTNYSALSLQLPELQEKVTEGKNNVRVEVHHFYHNKPPSGTKKDFEKFDSKRKTVRDKKYVDQINAKEDYQLSPKRINESPRGVANRDQERLTNAAILVATNKQLAEGKSPDNLDSPVNDNKILNQYYLKIAAYQDYSLLEEKGKQLEAYDLTPAVQIIESKGKRMYRLYIGIFQEQHADEWLAYLKQEGWNPVKILDTKAESDGDFYPI